MSDRTRRLRRLALFMLASLLVAGGAEAQPYRSHRNGYQEGTPARSGPSRPPPRQFADPDRAANAAREATGGRVLGVQGADRDGRPGYRVRILEPGGRVRNFHYDPPNGRD